MQMHTQGKQSCGLNEDLYLLPAWTDAFLAANDKTGGIFVATLIAYAAADMNVLKAAAQLSVHPNTIYARPERIFDLTGLDARAYHGLTEMLIVADCGRQAHR